MLLQLCAAICCLGLQTGQTVKTDYLPSRDLPDFKNPANFVNQGGSKGMCNGIDELSNAFLEVRRRNPNAFSLNEIAGIIKKYHGEDYLNKTMATATAMAYSNGTISANLKRDPNQFVSDVVSRMQATNRPQSILLTEPDGTSHRVTAYGATQTATGWTLNIADSNHPERAVADHVTLSIDGKTGKLASSIPGQSTESWSQGGVVPNQAQVADHYIDMINMAILGKPIEEIRQHVQPVEANSIPQEAIDAQRDPKTGGVLIRFDPALFTGTVDEAKLADLNKRLGSFLESWGGGAVILNLQPKTRKVSLVPFASILPGGTLGGLTRIEGFVVKPDGAAYLAGVKEAGQEPIPSEWLTVALQAEYAKGLSPYISLDPDPQTYSGPQNVRIGEIQESLRSSSFIKSMLDADYLMKKINLGKEIPKIDGFQSWIERMSEGNAGGAVRMWFTPMTLPAADSYIYRHDGATAVLFESQVALLSERQKTADETGFASGPQDGVAEGAARDFGSHLDELSLRYPEFHRLRGVFDVSKLAVCWRALNLKPNGVERWLVADVPKVSVPATYPGIGPDLTKDGKFVVSGGAIAKARFKHGASVETDKLSPMLEAGTASDIEVTLPATLPIAESTQAGFQAQNLIAAAQTAIRAGQLEQALVDVRDSLAIDPEDDEAETLEATALGLTKHYGEAIALADKLAPRYPELVGLRAVFKAASGDVSGALADSNQAESSFPDSEGVLATVVAARLLALDADGATKTLARLRAVCPAHPAIATIDAQIDLIRFLGPERAKKRMELSEQLSAPLSLALMNSSVSPDRLGIYKDALAKLQSGEYFAPADLYVPERLRLAMACSTMLKKPEPDDLKAIALGADQIVADHPNWASGYLAKYCVMVAIDAPVNLTVNALDKFAELEVNPDPVLTEFQITVRMPRMAAHLAAMASADATVRPELRHGMAVLAAKLAAGEAGQPFLALIAANPQVDAAVLSEAIQRGVIFASEQDVTKVLDKMTASVEGIPSSDPAFVPALSYCADALELVNPSSPAYARIMHRAATLARAGSPSRYLIPLAAKFRSRIWVRLALETTRPVLASDSAGVKSMGPAVAKMDHLMSPDSAKDSLPIVEQGLNALVNAMTPFLHTIRASIKDSLSSIRSQYGDETADAVALALVDMQAQMAHDDGSDLKKLASLHPGIEKTQSYAALAALDRNMAAGLLLTEPQNAIWRRLLVGIKTRYDGESVDALLTTQAKAGSKQGAVLASYLSQCKAKTELGTSLSGS